MILMYGWNVTIYKNWDNYTWWNSFSQFTRACDKVGNSISQKK